MLHQINDHVKALIDAAAAAVSFATLAKVLPVLASGFSIAWLVIRLYDRIKYGPSIKD